MDAGFRAQMMAMLAAFELVATTTANTVAAQHADSVAITDALNAFKAEFHTFGPASLYWLALGNLVTAGNTKLDLLHTDNVAILAKLEVIRAAIVIHV